jgi:hypothetical protein
MSCIYRRRLEVLNFEGGGAGWAPINGGKRRISGLPLHALPWMAPRKEWARLAIVRIEIK